MAKILEDVIAIKFSKLIKEGSDHSESVTGPEVLISLEEIVQELVGDSVIVEVVSG